MSKEKQYTKHFTGTFTEFLRPCSEPFFIIISKMLSTDLYLSSVTLETLYKIVHYKTLDIRQFKGGP